MNRAEKKDLLRESGCLTAVQAFGPAKSDPYQIGKPQLGILWSRDILGFKRLFGNSS